ncbi:MAG: hypothetical protein LQ349_004226 [Xanthoria aureola]|nr:MAG: hypothetical protein LQ349_004226 [Xanthoria aureola]
MPNIDNGEPPLSNNDLIPIPISTTNFFFLSPMSPTLIRLAPRILPPLRRTISTTPLCLSDNKPNSPSWSGRQPSEHVTNRNDELDVHSGASKSGARQRAEDDQHEGSSATSQKDPGNQNEKAKRDHPEAPGPVIGMNDERGGVSY